MRFIKWTIYSVYIQSIRIKYVHDIAKTILHMEFEKQAWAPVITHV